MKTRKNLISVSSKTVKTNSKELLIKLSKKYLLDANGKSKQQMANNLCESRIKYLTQKDRKLILPFCSDKNKKIINKLIKTNEKPDNKLALCVNKCNKKWNPKDESMLPVYKAKELWECLHLCRMNL